MNGYESFGIDVESLFISLNINNSEQLGRLPEFTWYPKNRISELAPKIKERIKESPIFCHSIHEFEFNTGEINTLNFLWLVRKEPERVAALLICSSLFSRIKSSHGHYPTEYWPPCIAVEELDSWADSKWKSTDIDISWHRSCHRVLPVWSKDFHYEISNIHGLIRYLAEEHCKLLSMYSPVRVMFS